MSSWTPALVRWIRGAYRSTPLITLRPFHRHRLNRLNPTYDSLNPHEHLADDSGISCQSLALISVLYVGVVVRIQKVDARQHRQRDRPSAPLGISADDYSENRPGDVIGER